MHLLRFFIAWLVGLQFVGANTSISERDVIDVILGSREAQVSDDVNRDFRVDVADLIKLYREGDERRTADAGVPGLVWLNGEASDLDQLLSDTPDAVNELAVVIGALISLPNSPFERSTLLVIADEVATRSEYRRLWGDEWNERFQSLFSQLHMGGDLDGDGVAEENALSLQVEAFQNINPFAFGAVLAGHSVDTPFLPRGLRANPNTLALRRQLINRLDPSAGWFLSWLVAVAGIDEPQPVFEDGRRQVFSRILEWEGDKDSELSLSSEWAMRKLVASGDEMLIRNTVGETTEQIVAVEDSEEIKVSTSVLDARTLFIDRLQRTDWESEQLGLVASSLELSPSDTSVLLLKQIDRRLRDEGVRQYSQLIRFDSGDVEPEPQAALLSDKIESYFQTGVSLGLLSDEYPVSSFQTVLSKMSDLNDVPRPDDLSLLDDQALAMEAIVDSFKVIVASDRTVFYGANGRQLLQRAAVPLGRIVRKVWGTRFRVGESLPVVDALFQRALAVDGRMSAWEEWLEPFRPLREDLDLVAELTGSISEPTTIVVQRDSYPLLSPSRLGDASIRLGPSAQRLLGLTCALFLYEQGAYLHRQHAFTPFLSTPDGVPPRPPAVDALEKYLLAWRLLVDAMPSSELGWASRETLDLHGLLPVIEMASKRLVSELGRAMPLAVHGIDFWGVGDKPFSSVPIDEIKAIASRTVGMLEAQEAQERDQGITTIDAGFQKEILGGRIESQVQIVEAKRFEVSAAEHAVQAMQERLAQSEMEIDAQDIEIAIAESQLNQVQLLADAREFRATASEFKSLSEMTTAEARQQRVVLINKQREIAERQIERKLASFDVIKMRSKEIGSAINEIKRNVQTAFEICQTLEAEYDDARLKVLDQAICVIKEPREQGWFEKGLNFITPKDTPSERYVPRENLSTADCEREGGFKDLNYDPAKYSLCGDSGGGFLGAVIGEGAACAASNAWDAYGDEILAVASVVSVATVGFSVVGVGKAVVGTVQGIAEGDLSGVVSNVTQLATAVGEIPGVRLGVTDLLKDTGLTEVVDSIDSFANDSKAFNSFLKSGSAPSFDVIMSDVSSVISDSGFDLNELDDEFLVNAAIESVAEPLQGLGISFALNNKEMERFVARAESLGEDALSLADKEVVANIFAATRERVKRELNENGFGEIVNVVLDFAEISDFEAGQELLEKKLVRELRDRGYDVKDVMKAMKCLYEGVINDELAEDLASLEGIPEAVRLNFRGVFQSHVDSRLGEVLGSTAGGLNSRHEDVLNELPAEIITAMEQIKKTGSQIEPEIRYLSDRTTHVDRLNKNAQLKDENGYLNARSAHIGDIVASLERMAALANEAEEVHNQIKIYVVQQRRELDDQLFDLQSEIEESEIEGEIESKIAKAAGFDADAADASSEAAQLEFQAAITRVATGKLQKDSAEKRKAILELVVREYQALVNQRLAELDATRAFLMSAQSELRIAELELERFQTLEAIGKVGDFGEYFLNRHKEMIYSLALRSIFDFAQTHDLVHGTDFLSLVRALRPNNAQQFATLLEHFELLLFERKLDSRFIPVGKDDPDAQQSLSISMNESWLAHAVVLPEFALDSRLQPTGGIRDEWYVWQIETVLAAGDDVIRHPGRSFNKTDVRHRLSPAGLIPPEKVRQVQFQGSVERLVLEEVRFSTVTPNRGFTRDRPETPGRQGNEPVIRLVHLGDMWFAGATRSLALQNRGEAPVISLPGVGYGLPQVVSLKDFFHNNQYLIEKEAPGFESASTETVVPADEFFGANYPLFGTWWILIKKEFLENQWDLKITLRGSGVLQRNLNDYQDSLENQVFRGNEPTRVELRDVSEVRADY